MAVRIRLKRIGAKKAPAYRIVVVDGRAARDGAVIEELGTYEPNKAVENVKIDKERAGYWVSKGAMVSPTAKNILKKENIK